jgi:hypothetical protein
MKHHDRPPTAGLRRRSLRQVVGQFHRPTGADGRLAVWPRRCHESGGHPRRPPQAPAHLPHIVRPATQVGSLRHWARPGPPVASGP